MEESNDPSSLRRSARARNQPKSLYDDALNAMAEKKQASKDDELITDEEEDSSNNGDEEETEYQSLAEPKKKKQKGKKSSAMPKTKRAIQVKAGTARKTNAPRGRRGIQAALTALSKKCLDASETPANSLVAALLASSKPIEGISSRSSTRKTDSLYTSQLEGIARKVVRDNDQNSLHIALLNLIFRSVGGSVESNVQEGTDLEELNENEWDSLVADVVEEMQVTELETLLCAIPTEKMGFQEYRAIYKEFWYRLGSVLLSHTQQQQSMDDGDDVDTEDTPFSSNRFQVESVRELVSRIKELVLVGQPDLRSAATIAVWQLALTCMERSVELEQKLQVASRQYKASSGQSRKLQSLKFSMDSWKRHKAELEEIVQTSVFQGVFIHRYRDSNPFIRIDSMKFLGKLSLLRPDLFLENKYLKYFGWMACDKDANVRLAALQGLLAPFHEYKKASKQSPLQIDISDMEGVCNKFLGRIVDCTADSEDIQVQEVAMELLLNMLKEEFLDEWEDEDGWDQVNLKALDKNTSAKVRKDALYFILDQLDSFDTEDDGGDARSTVSQKSSMSHGVSEKKQVERIESIASWVANKLCDGPIKLNSVRVDLSDYVIESLRDMPEHRHLAVNWSAILKAIRSENPQQGRNAGQEESVKQQVLLRMLACAAELESRGQSAGSKRKHDDHQAPGALSLALLKSLPQLLTAFKGDVLALQSLTKLPRFLTPSVFSLPSRKNDFMSLVKTLTRIFLESTDETVLQNIASAIFTLVDGDHVRVTDVKMQLKRLSSSLQDRLMELLRETDPQSQQKKSKRSTSKKRTKRRSDESTTSTEGTDSLSPAVDLENSIALCLMRWRTLVKRCPIHYLFDDSEADDMEVDGFCNSISEAIAKRLQDRKPRVTEEDETETDGKSVATAWREGDMAIHSSVASAVDGALQVLLCILSWKLIDGLESSKSNNDDSMDLDDSQEVAILQMRDRLEKLVGLCFDQFIDESDGIIYSDEQIEFATSVQASAARVASDIRTLFPREWSGATDRFRQSLALKADTQLIGGSARYLQHREAELQQMVIDDDDTKAASTLVNELLLPLARSLTANWNDGNRKEAGIALSYITGRSQEATTAVQGMARFLKKINSVRFLEAQMACLRMSFENWLQNEPEEPETDTPTEEQLHRYEEAEKRHAALFHNIEQQAFHLSRLLGVGKLTDKKLSRALASFMEEGVRFAFDGNREEEDELILGSRLPFLTILGKYSTWAKKNKGQLEVLKDFLLSKESQMRSHAEFNEVHPDDLEALRSFKESLGLKVTSSKGSTQSLYEEDENDEVEDHTSAMATPSPGTKSTSSRRRISTAGSVMSRMSTQSSLPPVYEEDGALDSESGDGESPLKRRKLTSNSMTSSVSKSIGGSTIVE